MLLKLHEKSVYNGTMQKDFENFSAMQQSADSFKPTDSFQRNHAPNPSDQSNSIKELRATQKIVEEKEQNIAEQNLNEELNDMQNNEITSENLHEFLDKYFPENAEAEKVAANYLKEQKLFGVTILESKLKELISERIDFISGSILKADEAITLKAEMSEEGKSDQEILQTLLSKYEGEPTLKTWVENWRKFLELHSFARTKPPKERKAIETIISNTNFTADNSFETALSEIENSSDISSETKFDIQRKFNTIGINTVRVFDITLKHEKKYKKNIKKKIRSRNFDIQNLNHEIQKLTTELGKLPLANPRRSALKAKIKEKSNLIISYEQELSVLNEAKPDKVQFQLRSDLMGVLNLDGSRSVNIVSENYTIQLPSHKLPFSGMQNLRSINVAFPYLALRSQQISDEIFAPDLVVNTIPTKAQRDMAHLIHSSLGIDDSRILSEKDISQIKDDLSCLTNTKSGETGRECLVKLKIYDVASQNVNRIQFKKALQFIRNNRGKMINNVTLNKYLNSEINM